ncbi:hypothetical protein ES707_00986 [subsurface metagenome]|jgi:hypothetical protein
MGPLQDARERERESLLKEKSAPPKQASQKSGCEHFFNSPLRHFTPSHSLVRDKDRHDGDSEVRNCPIF